MGRQPALSAEDVELVWSFYRNTAMKQSQIARFFKVSPGVIAKVLDKSYTPKTND